MNSHRFKIELHCVLDLVRWCKGIPSLGNKVSLELNCDSFKEKLYHCIKHIEDMEVMSENFSDDYFTVLNQPVCLAHDKGVEEGLVLGKAEGKAESSNII